MQNNWDPPTKTEPRAHSNQYDGTMWYSPITDSYFLVPSLERTLNARRQQQKLIDLYGYVR